MKLSPLLEQEMQKVDLVIRADLNSDIALIRQISEYIILSGGKRVRPLITILAAKMIDGQISSPNLYKMAAMIEYIHTATLLHDDVVDESGLRRGRKTANAVFGNAASVLVGDFIYTRAFQLMVETDSLAILAVMAKCTNQISEGEVLQLLNISNSAITEKDYFAVIEAKTAILFEAAAKVGAIVANAIPDDLENLVAYAKNLGIAFQITDDILDYVGEHEILGKNIGDDLHEGKVTLPLIYLLKNGDATTQDVIKQAISDPKNADISQIIAIVNKSGAINYCKDLAVYYSNTAIESLRGFADSAFKSFMLELARMNSSRSS